MSRSGFHEMDDWDMDVILSFGRTQGRIASAIRGRRGQAFLKSAPAAMDRMEDKRLASDTFGVSGDGCMCLMSSLATETGKASAMTGLAPWDWEGIRLSLANAFNVAPVLVDDLVWQNDKNAPKNPAERWEYMRDLISARLKSENQAEVQS